MFLWKMKAAVAVVLAACLLAAGATAVLSQTGSPASSPDARSLQDGKPCPADAPPAEDAGGKKSGPRRVDADAQETPQAAQKNPTLEKALQVARDMPINDRGDKVRYLAEIASIQFRAGDKETARKTIQLAVDSIKEVGKINGQYKIGALGSIFRHHIVAGDLKAARKTLAVVQDIRDTTMDENVKLICNSTVDAFHGEIARLQARAGETKEALKTVAAIDNLMVRVGVTGAIAVEQAKRKDFQGALATLAPLNSVRQAELLAAVATVQEKTDKAGAEKTWKLALKALDKIEVSKVEELYPWPGGIKLNSLIRALAERGHGAAVHQWIEGLPEPEVQVHLLLILAGKE